MFCQKIEKEETKEMREEKMQEKTQKDLGRMAMRPDKHGGTSLTIWLLRAGKFSES